MNRQHLERLAADWRRRIFLREILFAVAAAFFAGALACWRPELGRWQLPWVIFITTMVGRLVVTRPWDLDTVQITTHLNRLVPALEESAALFLRAPESLTVVERLQMDRVSPAALGWSASPQRLGGPPRHFLRRAGSCMAAGLLVYGLAAVYLSRQFGALPLSKREPSSDSKILSPSLATAVPPPKVLGNVFTVTPPAYTGHPARVAEGFAAEVEEGSTVDCTLKLDRPTTDAHLSAGSAATPLRVLGGTRLEATLAVHETTLFTLLGRASDGTPWSPPELISIKVIKDLPPRVRFVLPALSRTEIIPPASSPLVIEAIVTDDYGVGDAVLVATVAKGSGEAVKFREQRIPFDTDSPTELPAARRFTKSLDLAALGLEPGDELYFFAEARDNRQPTANSARSETRFVRLRGPEEKKTSPGFGVAGVNLIPQYFRSERQIIIDTENLIAVRSGLAETEFRARANSLGEDQALLRLRYGRFLGEDQEESPLTDHLETVLDPLQAPVPAATRGPHAAASIAQRFRQEHVTQDREGGGEGAPGSPPDGTPLSAAQIRQPFVDSHDQHDKNTFFDNQTRGTMSDALSAMWEAERFLRTARPQEALPPEQRALEILKDLQQSDRAYVQHVGFESAPLKVDERRLKGESADVPPRLPSNRPLPLPDPALAQIRLALNTLTQSEEISGQSLDDVEIPLSAAATRQPEDFLPGLQALRRLRAGVTDPGKERSILQRALLRLLPRLFALPLRPIEPVPTLAPGYFQALQREATTP